MRSLLVFPIAAFVALTGCGNPSDVVDVNFAASASIPDDPDSSEEGDPDDTDPPGDPTPEEPQLSCGTVVIKDLRISTEDSNDPQIAYRPWADLDLTDPDASTLNDLPVNAGTYRRVRFTMHKRTGNDSGGPGTGNPDVNHSIHLCGTWQGIAWDYTDDTTDNVDRQDPAGVEIDTDGPAKLFVIFDSSTWFDGIDLAQATPAADGTVYLSHSENSQQQRALRENFKASVRLANSQHQ